MTPSPAVIQSARCGVGCGEMLVLARDNGGQLQLVCPLSHRPGGHRLVNLRSIAELPVNFLSDTAIAHESWGAYWRRKYAEASTGHSALREVRQREGATARAVCELYEASARLFHAFAADEARSSAAISAAARAG